MGVSSSPQELAGKLNRLAKDIGDVKVPLNATALHVKNLMQASAAGAGALGARPGKRRKIAVRYSLKGAGTHMVAVIGYEGPAHLINNPTGRHRIEPRRPRGRATGRRRGAMALTINGSVRAWANHPGTSGKHFFEKAKAVAERTAPRVYARKGLTEPLRRNF